MSWHRATIRRSSPVRAGAESGLSAPARRFVERGSIEWRLGKERFGEYCALTVLLLNACKLFKPVLDVIHARIFLCVLKRDRTLKKD